MTEVLRKGASKAREVAAVTYDRARKAVGLLELTAGFSWRLSASLRDRIRAKKTHATESVVVGFFEGVGEVGRERPVLLGQVMLAGPRDREGVAPREGEAVGADLRVSHVEPDLAREAACLGPLLGRASARDPAPRAWRRHGRTRRAARRSCRRRAAGRRPAPGGSPRGRVLARLAARRRSNDGDPRCSSAARGRARSGGAARAPTPCRPARDQRATATRRSACSDGRTPLVTPLLTRRRLQQMCPQIDRPREDRVEDSGQSQHDDDQHTHRVLADPQPLRVPRAGHEPLDDG